MNHLNTNNDRLKNFFANEAGEFLEYRTYKNVDEEGHDEYVDSPKNELVVVPKDNSDKFNEFNFLYTKDKYFSKTKMDIFTVVFTSKGNGTNSPCL